jgi:RNA polymerase sigma-32 factor
MKEKDKLEAQGIVAGPKLLAERLDVKERDVIEMEKRLSGRGTELSIDNRMDPTESNSPAFKDSLTDNSPDQSVILEREELLHRLEMKLPELMKLLNEKELKILEQRILAEDPLTLQEVADQYGLTRERVRQIETKVVQKFKTLLANDLGLIEQPRTPLQLEDKRGIRKSN